MSDVECLVGVYLYIHLVGVNMQANVHVESFMSRDICRNVVKGL